MACECLSEKLFYERFLKYLSQITELNFEQKQSQQTLQKMLQWMGLDFCFIVNNNLHPLLTGD